MSVLIVGAAGQVGRALVASAPSDASLIALARADLDVTNEAAVSACIDRHRPELIVNAAAYTAVDRAESEPEAARRVNAEAVRYLAAAAVRTAARLVHVSTDFVFDGQSGTPYGPESETNPLNVYGQTKLAGERAAREILPERSVILRTAWVYAPYGTNFLLTMLRQMEANGTARVVADQIGTPTAASSVARAIWALHARPDIRGIQHWTDAGAASWYDFAVAIAEEACALGMLPSGVTVRPIAAKEYPRPARRPSFSVLDVAGLPKAIGLEPVHWRANLRSVLREICRA